LRSPVAASFLPNSEQLQDEVNDLLHVFAKLNSTFPTLLELRKELASLQILLRVRGQRGSELLEYTLADCTARSEQGLKEIHKAFGSTGYPFEHPKGHISIVDYARAKQYDADPVRMIQIEISSHLQTLFALYYRILGRLVSIALEVEAVLDKSSGPALTSRSAENS
jgi:hypothetical protein